jgi:hypothetical protein
MGGYMSIIQAGNTTTTALIYTADTTGNLVFTTGGSNTVALTLSNTQAATFANTIAISGATSGAVTLSVPAVAGSNTVTIAAQTGTLNAAGPAFSVYRNGTQTITSGVVTKLQLNTEVFDTNNNFDSTTNYRFTPTIAGYYQINGAVLVEFSSSNGFISFCSVFKNGSEYNRGAMYYAAAGGQIAQGSTVATVVYFNGSTDYIELYVRGDASTGTITTANNSAYNWCSGSLIRGA